MAIRIPSAKTYNRQNPKVRDNVVERIEVGAVEITPNNEYETPVYNSVIDMADTTIAGTNSKSATQVKRESDEYLALTNASGAIIYDIYATIKEIKIKKVEGNKAISRLFTALKSSGESYTQINKKVSKTIYKYEVADSLTYTGVTEGTNVNGYYDFDNIRRYTGDKTVYQKREFIDDFQRFSVRFYDNGGGYGFSITVTPNPTGIEEATDMDLSAIDLFTYARAYISSDEKTTVAFDTLKIDEPYKEKELDWEETDEYYIIKNIKFLYERDMYACATRYMTPAVNSTISPAQVIEIKQIANQAEITLYGNTIGIDLNDKTVYINGEAQKKVHSVEGNELMQTSNYLLDSGAKAIETMYGATQKEYELGKETATIRCSIGDYYDYKSGEKVISADFIGKDTFHDEYQEVEYIESTGTQYIDTGIYSDKNTEVELVGKTAGTGTQYLFGCSLAGTRYMLAQQNSGSYLIFDFISSNFRTASSIVGYSDFHKIVIKDNNFSIDDKPIGSIESYSNFTPTTTSWLFGANGSSPSACIIKYCKVWQSGNLVRDFIPVYRKSDGAIGLYDLVGKSFYANAGTGTFLKGSDTEVEVEPTGKALKMSFEIGDEVIPMVYGADGKDYPMSTYKNGSPKVFVVRGSKIFYDGAIFQEIFLQERLTN